MSVDLSGEITAIATAALAVFAIVTAVFAVFAFRKQSQEVHDQAAMLTVQSDQLEEQRKINAEQAKVLALQASELRESLDERKREAGRRHRAQAGRVFITTRLEVNESGGGFVRPAPSGMIRVQPIIARVENTSDEPIYDAELRWYLGPEGFGEPNPQPLGIIMPGALAARTRSFPEDTNLEVSGAAVRFTDAAGVRWLRRLDGYLGEYTDP